MVTTVVNTDQSLIDRYLPQYHLRKAHSIQIRQTDTAIFKAVHALTMREVRVARFLMALRGLPGLLGTSHVHTRSSSTVMEDAQRMGFIILDEDFGREMVLGLVGQFWRLRGGIQTDICDTAAFLSFAQPHCAKAVVNFRVDPVPHSEASVLSTETRVWLTSPDAEKSFRSYWRVVSPGSALIRLAWLRAVKRRAERIG